MDIEGRLSRREVMKAATTGVAAASLLQLTGPAWSQTASTGRLKQSVARWCYGKMTVDDLARAAAEMGIRGMDLVDIGDWPVLKKHGLVCAIANGGGSIPEGLNRKQNHDKLEQQYREIIPKVAAAGFPNVIAFSGNRRGLSDQDGIENCIIGLNRVKTIAEENEVTICLELLNSKVDHKDYQCDHTEWGAEVVKKVSSPRVKLLYDIYHMQIMEGDIIRTIRQNAQWIGHYHTGGVPGRHELDETQELNWNAIARAIADTGYTGYFAHEFVPVRDPLTSLREAVRLCTV
ncbi:MAG TPA: TIM barrel protein [Acidobacteriota bacterium]|nr:TIM barrel protein [Acidobacteriota bacterium]